MSVYLRRDRKISLKDYLILVTSVVVFRLLYVGIKLGHNV